MAVNQGAWCTKLSEESNHIPADEVIYYGCEWKMKYMAANMNPSFTLKRCEGSRGQLTYVLKSSKHCRSANGVESGCFSLTSFTVGSGQQWRPAITSADRGDTDTHWCFALNNKHWKRIRFWSVWPGPSLNDYIPARIKAKFLLKLNQYQVNLQKDFFFAYFIYGLLQLRPQKSSVSKEIIYFALRQTQLLILPMSH